MQAKGGSASFSYLIYGIWCWLSAQTVYGASELCPRLSIQGELDPPLTESEKNLLCGGQPDWQNIPFAQMEYAMKNFLQDRGYYHPQWIHQDKKSLVILKNPTWVSQISVEGAPPAFDFQHQRGIIGKRLTPQLLTDLEQWSVQRLRALGYPCPQVQSEADPDRGHIRLKIHPGALLRIHFIHEESIPEIAPGVLSRYQAFQEGEVFHGDWLILSEQRMVTHGLVQSVHHSVACEPQGAVIRRLVTVGPPRILSFGFGINTEGWLLGKASWKNTRLDRLGSKMDFTALASYRQQRVDISMNQYFFHGAPRVVTKPAFEFKHLQEDPFEFLATQLEVSLGNSWDQDNLSTALQIGPTWDVVRTLRGSGPLASHFLSLKTELHFSSHDFEFFRWSPRSGMELNLMAKLNSRSFYSDQTAQLLQLSGEGLWNFLNEDPPLVVIGLRGQAATTMTSESLSSAGGLSVNLRHFLGGSQNLRGFGRNELPLDGLGRLSSAFLGVEIRLSDLLPLKLQPFVFSDVGALGSRTFQLESPVYLSPGLGMRWESPVGVFRATLARGNGDQAHAQFYFSYGEEF